MDSTIFGGDSTIHLEERFGNLESINSLIIWATMLLSLGDVIISKCCTLNYRNEDFPSESTRGSPNSCNACSLRGACPHEACQLGRGLTAKGEDQLRIPDACARKSTSHDCHHVFYGTSFISIRFPNGAIMVSVLANVRNHDSTILAWFAVGNILVNLCLIHNLPLCIFYTKSFSGSYLRVRAPH